MYIDIYIIENLLINYIIISCTSILIKNLNSYIKKIAGTLLGTIYSVGYLFNEFSILYTIPFKIIFIIFIASISFSYVNKKEFIKALEVFFLVNFFVCGSTYFIIYFTGISHLKISFIIICVYICCKLLRKIYFDITLFNYISDFTKEIIISFLGEEIKCTAFLDSGNLLKDPLSKNDVVMVNFKVLKDYLPKDYNYEYINVVTAEKIINQLDTETSERVRLIPYNHAATNKTEMILGFKADYLQIDDKKIGNIVLGVSNFENNNYNAILNPSILS